MVRYLLDTNVLSATYRASRQPQLASWLAARSNPELSLSAVSIGEIWRGVVKLRRTDPARAGRLEAWLATRIIPTYASSILPADYHVMRRWGELAADKNNRHDVDLIIAATAAEHGLVVATRNLRHFEPLGVDAVDPTGS